jgi:hypothetical protein
LRFGQNDQNWCWFWLGGPKNHQKWQKRPFFNFFKKWKKIKSLFQRVSFHIDKVRWLQKKRAKTKTVKTRNGPKKTLKIHNFDENWSLFHQLWKVTKKRSFWPHFWSIFGPFLGHFLTPF